MLYGKDTAIGTSLSRKSIKYFLTQITRITQKRTGFAVLPFGMFYLYILSA